MSDPVASKSAFLCTYMSNHPDTLVAYVRYWGKVNDNVTNARLVAIDTKGMNLAYQTKASGNAKKQLRVEFDPPLAGYEEVKPRLLSMKVDAEEALGMAPAPQITSFEVPANAYILLTGTMILLLIYVTFAPAPTSPTYSPLFKAGYTLRSSLPPWAVPASWYGGGFIHILEALYAYTMCKKHRTGLWTGVQYVLGTLFLGFPILIELRRQRHNARIDSILKGK